MLLGRAQKSPSLVKTVVEKGSKTQNEFPLYIRRALNGGN